MTNSAEIGGRQGAEASELKSFVRGLGVDLVGIADLGLLEGMPRGIVGDATSWMQRYRRAVVLGAQLGKGASGTETNVFLEKAALEMLAYLEDRGSRALIVHTEDEYDPVNRMGLLSLKVLAKAAGLGWQGRSLLVISPDYGPIHRLIALLTDLPLQADEPIANQCGDCSVCVDSCPQGALRLAWFDDHPARREDVLDIKACKGDAGCMACLVACPRAHAT